MHKHLIIIVMVLQGMFSLAQNDSVLVTELNNFNDGLYLTPYDFRKNNSIPKENIITTIDKEQFDFYNKITASNVIKYVVGATTYSIETKMVWGFVQNKTLFVNYNNAFFRVPVFGSICYFAGVVEVVGYYNGVYDPMFGSGVGRTVKTKEVREFVMSYYNGNIINFDIDSLGLLLSNDEEVYKQFKSLSKRKRQNQASRFIRMYNERHPIYYLK